MDINELVDTVVRNDVRDIVRKKVGIDVGKFVCTLVRLEVGDVVGKNVGIDVRKLVGTCENVKDIVRKDV